MDGDTGENEQNKAETAEEISILHEPVEHTRQECRQALLVLDKNINSMLDNIDPDNVVNPLQPEIIYNAFWDSCDDLRCGAEVRLIMLQMFQRQVAMDLVNIYGDINALLDFCLQENSYTQVVNNDSRDSTDINAQPPDKTEHYDPQLVKL